MILITGPLYSGKRDFARSILSPGGFEKRVCSDAQELVRECGDVAALAQRLAEQYEVVILTETGGGVVPVDASQRREREAAGRLGCLLAARADTVVRIFCGLPLILKGELPR